MITFYNTKKEYNHDLYTLGKAFNYSDIAKVTNIEESSTENIKASIANSKNLDLKEKTKSPNIIIFVIQKEDQIDVEGFLDYKKTFSLTKNISFYDKKLYRNLLKRLVYSCLSNLTKKTLQWGTLTGVSPTKIILQMLEEQKKEEKIIEYMKEQYYCSDEKINLSLQVAKKELTLLNTIDYKNGYSLYIGIPFCPSTCLYCSFASYPLEKFKEEVEKYLQALMKEISFAASCFRDKKLSTIYIGGGTPTTLSENQLERLLNHIQNTIDLKDIKEYTVEAGRPDSITLEKLQILKRYNVSRISINPQTMSQKTLDLIGRKHRVEQIIESFENARKVGHNNINMDIIIGLPGENIKDLHHTLNEIDKLQPDGLTVHALAIKRAARLKIEEDYYKDLKSRDTIKMNSLTKKYTKEMGYMPYYLYRQKNVENNLENVGYAKAGKEGLYNILMMEDKQTILALGAGAFTKFVFEEENRVERVENVKNLKDYIERIDEMIERKRNFITHNLNTIGGIK